MSSIGVLMPVFFIGSRLIEDPHCTLIYLGEFGKVKVDRSKLEQAVNRLRGQCQPINVSVTGVEVFGNGTSTVLTLAERTLLSYRTFLEKELAHDNIRSASQWAYRPHVTIATHEPSKTPLIPEGLTIPQQVWIDRPQVWWNGEKPSLIRGL